MAIQKFEIYYLGLKLGVTELQAVAALAKLLGIEDEAAEAIIRKPYSVLSSGLTEDKAKEYLEAFNQVGLAVELRPCSVQQNGFLDSKPADFQQNTNNQSIDLCHSIAFSIYR